MMGGEAPETCWATHKRQVINLWNCCIWLVDLFESYDDARTCDTSNIFLLLVSYRARCRVSCPFLVKDVTSSLLYLSRRRRDVQAISYFFGFSVHASQRSLPSLWSVTNVRRLSCQMMRLFCCNQNRSAWIDCSKNSKHEISRKNVRWELYYSMRMGGRSGWRNDGHTCTRTHKIHASMQADGHSHMLASRTRQQIAFTRHGRP